MFFREKRDLSKRQFQSYILTETERKENFVKRGFKRVLQLFSIFVLSEALYFSMDKGLHCCQISVLVSFVIDLMMMMTGRPSLIRHLLGRSLSHSSSEQQQQHQTFSRDSRKNLFYLCLNNINNNHRYSDLQSDKVHCGGRLLPDHIGRKKKNV